VAEREAAEIRIELDQARERLDRLAPQRLMDQTKTKLQAKATSPVGIAVLAGTGLLLTLLVVRNLRRSRH
jgi:hypothetical protein